MRSASSHHRYHYLLLSTRDISSVFCCHRYALLISLYFVLIAFAAVSSSTSSGAFAPSFRIPSIDDTVSRLCVQEIFAKTVVSSSASSKTSTSSPTPDENRKGRPGAAPAFLAVGRQRAGKTTLWNRVVDEPLFDAAHGSPTILAAHVSVLDTPMTLIDMPSFDHPGFYGHSGAAIDRAVELIVKRSSTVGFLKGIVYVVTWNSLRRCSQHREMTMRSTSSKQLLLREIQAFDTVVRGATGDKNSFGLVITGIDSNSADARTLSKWKQWTQRLLASYGIRGDLNVAWTGFGSGRVDGVKQLLKTMATSTNFDGSKSQTIVKPLNLALLALDSVLVCPKVTEGLWTFAVPKEKDDLDEEQEEGSLRTTVLRIVYVMVRGRWQKIRIPVSQSREFVTNHLQWFHPPSTKESPDDDYSDSSVDSKQPVVVFANRRKSFAATSLMLNELAGETVFGMKDGAVTSLRVNMSHSNKSLLQMTLVQTPPLDHPMFYGWSGAVLDKALAIALTHYGDITNLVWVIDQDDLRRSRQKHLRTIMQEIRALDRLLYAKGKSGRLSIFVACRTREKTVLRKMERHVRALLAEFDVRYTMFVAAFSRGAADNVRSVLQEMNDELLLDRVVADEAVTDSVIDGPLNIATISRSMTAENWAQTLLHPLHTWTPLPHLAHRCSADVAASLFSFGRDGSTFKATADSSVESADIDTREAILVTGFETAYHHQLMAELLGHRFELPPAFDVEQDRLYVRCFPEKSRSHPHSGRNSTAAPQQQQNLSTNPVRLLCLAPAFRTECAKQDGSAVGAYNLAVIGSSVRSIWDSQAGRIVQVMHVWDGGDGFAAANVALLHTINSYITESFRSEVVSVVAASQAPELGVSALLKTMESKMNFGRKPYKVIKRHSAQLASAVDQAFEAAGSVTGIARADLIQNVVTQLRMPLVSYAYMQEKCVFAQLELSHLRGPKQWQQAIEASRVQRRHQSVEEKRDSCTKHNEMGRSGSDTAEAGARIDDHNPRRRVCHESQDEIISRFMCKFGEKFSIQTAAEAFKAEFARVKEALVFFTDALTITTTKVRMLQECMKKSSVFLQKFGIGLNHEEQFDAKRDIEIAEVLRAGSRQLQDRIEQKVCGTYKLISCDIGLF